MNDVTIPRAIKPTLLVSFQDLHVLNESTKIGIRMTAGKERVVPPDFVGLALAAGALPGIMYKEQYGQYIDADGKVIGDLVVYPEEANPAIVIMEEKKPVVTENDKMEITEEAATQEEILVAIQKIQDIVAEKPDTRTRFVSADGRPKVPALEGILGKDITAAQRDAAWDALNTAMPS